MYYCIPKEDDIHFEGLRSPTHGKRAGYREQNNPTSHTKQMSCMIYKITGLHSTILTHESELIENPMNDINHNHKGKCKLFKLKKGWRHLCFLFGIYRRGISTGVHAVKQT